MSLFSRKKEGTKNPVCCCGCADTAEAQAEPAKVCEEHSPHGPCSIKVLGSGCKNCHALLENTKQAVENIDLEADIEFVTDMQKVMSYGVMSMPALVINEKVASMGKVCKPKEIQELLKKSGF